MSTIRISNRIIRNILSGIHFESKGTSVSFSLFVLWPRLDESSLTVLIAYPIGKTIEELTLPMKGSSFSVKNLLVMDRSSPSQNISEGSPYFLLLQYYHACSQMDTISGPIMFSLWSKVISSITTCVWCKM